MDDAEGLEVPWDFCEAIYALLRALKRRTQQQNGTSLNEASEQVRHIDRGPSGIASGGATPRLAQESGKHRVTAYVAEKLWPHVLATRSGKVRGHFESSIRKPSHLQPQNSGFESRRGWHWQENLYRGTMPGRAVCSPQVRSLARDSCCPMTWCGAERRTTVAAGLLLTQL